MTTWSKFADMIESSCTPMHNCWLEWELIVQKAGNGGHTWCAYSAVRMVFSATLGTTVTDEDPRANVPVTEVREVFIYEDGTVRWHSEAQQADVSIELATRIGEAVCTGKESGRDFRINWFPLIKSATKQ